MTTKDRHNPPAWLPKLTLPHIGGSPDLKEREAIGQLQGEVRQLRRALRWSLGFIVNVALGMEIIEGAKVETAQIRQGIKEGLKKSHVPRGALTKLEDVAAVLKEWDSRTFRVEQDLEVLEQTPERIVLKHESCPEVFATMRHHAPFLIDRVSAEHYLYLPSALDFLCVPHTLCRSVLVSWLSDNKFELEELGCGKNDNCNGVCAFAVKRAVTPTRRPGEGTRNLAET